MKSLPLSRRRFLVGAGGATLALPFLEAVSPRLARATPAAPKRLVVVLHNMGTRLDEWAQPGASETDFSLGKIMQPMEPYRERALWLWGVDNRLTSLCKSNGHNASNRTLLTCHLFSSAFDSDGALISRDAQEVNDSHAAGASIDHVVGTRLQTDHPFSTVSLQSGGSRGASRYLYAGKDDPIDSYHDPAEALDVYFPAADADQMAAATERMRRQSVLDAVLGNFNELRSTVGVEDRARLDAHADKLRDLEQRITSVRDCSRPSLSSPQELSADRTNSLQQDLLVAALSCDLAPVGTLLQGDNFDNMTYRNGAGAELPFTPSSYDNWHDLVHRGANVDDGSGGTYTEEGLYEGFRWHTEQFVQLLDKMDAVDEGEGTMLDSTLVLWVSMFGNGSGHNNRKLHLVLAGNAGAGVEMGRCLQYAPGNAQDTQDWTNSDHSTSQLMVSVLRAFGFEDQTFGYQADWVSPGGLPGLLT